MRRKHNFIVGTGRQTSVLYDTYDTAHRELRSRTRHAMTLLFLFLVIFAVLGLRPVSRQDWLLENVLVFVTLPILMLTSSRFRFSNTSYTFLFAFLVLHEVGAHYTYSQVPYDEWLSNTYGVTLAQWFGLRRNHYDRLIHFAYGLLLLFPLIELMRLVAPVRGWWKYVQPVALILAGSALYELIEWGAAAVFGGELGIAYVGTQGDEWDAQKDMACACAGAVLALLVLSVQLTVPVSRRSSVSRHPCS